VRIAAEASPFVHHYQGLLNTVFALGHIEWQRIPLAPEYRNTAVFDAYQSRFPELWKNHNLVLDISARLVKKAEAATVPERSDSASGHVLRLFVFGQSSLTERILKTLQSVLQTSHHPYTLQLVDVSKHPEQAEADQISATPTLLRVQPIPTRRLVGELTDSRALLNLLNEP
jgi:circadian clock protein KaiB